MFSKRTAWNREASALTEAVGERLARGLPLIDLTASNPTRCGFAYDAAGSLGALRDQRSLTYEANPFGLPEARASVCGYYRDQGAEVTPAQVCLTTSTSEAYSFLFRLLCDPGDEVLIAQPSYPLFDFLADLDDVRLVPYPLFYDHGWQTEPGALRSRITPRTRAIAVVHPNNPTGHFVSDHDRAELAAVCAEHGLALIVDEVFLDYPLGDSANPWAASGESAAASFARSGLWGSRSGSSTSRSGLSESRAGAAEVLTFVLSGLSKIAALPQMKASWIVTLGPADLAAEALARLELIADTFLSMSAPVQHALPVWLAGRAGLQRQIAERTRTNLARLDVLLGDALAGTSGARLPGLVSRLAVQAGWYAILRVPVVGQDGALVRELVEGWGVLVHPGFYYGFAGKGWLVVSLLPPEAEFEQGMRGVLACCAERLGGR